MIEEPNHISKLVNFISEEMMLSIVYNKDPSSLWRAISNHLQGSPLTSFRESMEGFVKTISGEVDMYNDLSSLVFRVFAEPYGELAINEFITGFDKVFDDPVFINGFSFTGRERTKVEQLLLFIVVYKDKLNANILLKQPETIKKRK